MIIGWLMDDPGYQGGAELDAEMLIAHAPSDVAVVRIPPDAPFADFCDGYVVGNCVQYRAGHIQLLEHKPVIKRIYDLWPHGSTELKQWLLAHASLVIPVSPMLLEINRLGAIAAPIECIPCAVELDAFEAPAAKGLRREGNVWIGRLYAGKGVLALARWAENRRTEVDVYGFGPHEALVTGRLHYRGEIAPEQVADVLARYKTFVFLPTERDACPRSVIEAWAAGCELVVNNNVGTLWWLKHDPAALRQVCGCFWNAVRKAVQG
jgi:glycosyltransferase involved in cell wall biosynthesis